MLDRVCLLVNENLYESKRVFTRDLAMAMHRKGIETKVVDAKEGVLNGKDIRSIQDFRPDFTCSFNSFSPLSDERYLWDLIKTPHLSFLVDPALYSVRLTQSPYSILSCVDRYDCTGIRSQGFERVFFWPHAVASDIEIGVEERPYEVVLLGSCYDYEALKRFWEENYPKEQGEVLDAAVKIVFSNDRVPLVEALTTAWQASGLDPSGVNFEMLFYYLDYYTRGRDRVELVRAIKDVPVHIFGELYTDHVASRSGWEVYCEGQANVTVHPSVPFEESLQVLNKSKVCLNSMPFFRDGTHERVFSSLACGAAVVNSESLFLRENFEADEGIVFYHSNRRDEVNGHIQDFLADEDQRQRMVKKGRERVMREHTWDARLNKLSEVLPPMLEKIRSLS